MKHIYLSLLTLIALFASDAVIANGRWYQVEVIVFRHTGANFSGDEIWPPLESGPDLRNSVELRGHIPGFSDEPSSEGSSSFRALPASELKLSGISRSLRNSSLYVPVLHVGWRQPGLSRSRAKPVYIADKRAAASEDLPLSTEIDLPVRQVRRIEGTIQMHLGRFLHVAADFVNYDNESAGQIREQRKIKLKELHYFDHPLFGVIVQITPYRSAGQASEYSTAEPQDD